MTRDNKWESNYNSIQDHKDELLFNCHGSQLDSQTKEISISTQEYQISIISNDNQNYLIIGGWFPYIGYPITNSNKRYG